jgi:hypothetical protein
VGKKRKNIILNWPPDFDFTLNLCDSYVLPTALEYFYVVRLSKKAFNLLDDHLFRDNNQQPIVLRGKPELLSSTAQQDFYLFNTGLSKEIILLYLVFGILLSVCSYQQNNAVNNHQTKKAPFHFQLQRI